MADSKRLSVAGKIATPKTTATPATPTMADSFERLRKSIGGRITITTTGPHSQTYEGTLFTACPTLSIVAINTRSTQANSSTTGFQPGDYHMIPISRIQSFTLSSLGSGADGSTVQAPLEIPDMKRLEERAQARIEKLKEQRRDKGPEGVTKEAQAIFDSFKRINMPIKWHNNQEMVVHDAVIIASPYRVEDCRCHPGKQEVLKRVRTALEGERKKLKEKEERDRKNATPAGQRKGG